jgi:hypothetical protein
MHIGALFARPSRARVESTTTAGCVSVIAAAVAYSCDSNDANYARRLKRDQCGLSLLVAKK